jgi:hypothetical protein
MQRIPDEIDFLLKVAGKNDENLPVMYSIIWFIAGMISIL